MRITNGMITNNTITNINANKVHMDKLNTQMINQKKITRPSDDPVVAIRALRLRSNLSELNQYYEKNISDATALLEVTEEALSNVSGILEDMYDNCVQGSNDTLTAEDRNTIVSSLTSLRDQLYAEGNADYAGRNLFTGYKTNSDLTFMEDDTDAFYNITETFSEEDLDSFTYISGSVEVEVDPSKLSTIDIAELSSDKVSSDTVYRIRLAYKGLESGVPNITYTDNSATPPVTTIFDSSKITVYGTVPDAAHPGVDPYIDVDPNGVNYIASTGEMILGENVYKSFQSLKANSDGVSPISVTYDKKGFTKGDLRPEHYFDCTDKVSGVNYEKVPQDIEYTINFNQKIKVNTEGSDVFTHNIGRDVNEILNSVSETIAAEEKVTKIKSMLEDSQYADKDLQTKLSSMLEAAEKELTLKKDKMQKLFAAGETKFQKYQNIADLQVTDIGSRVKRIELTENRLSAQQTTFKTLQIKNESVKVTDIAIEFTSASNAYEASLAATAKMVNQSLLNFL